MIDGDFLEFRIQHPMTAVTPGPSGGFADLKLRLRVLKRGEGWIQIDTAGGPLNLSLTRDDLRLKTMPPGQRGFSFNRFVEAVAAAGAYSRDALVPAVRDGVGKSRLARWDVGAHRQGGRSSIPLDVPLKLAVEYGGKTYLPRWVLLQRAREIDDGERGHGQHVVIPAGQWPGLDAAIGAWRTELGLDALEAEVKRLEDEREAERQRRIADAPRREAEAAARHQAIREAAEREAECRKAREEEERAKAVAREEKRRASQTDRVVEPAHVSGVTWVKNSYGSTVPQRWTIENCRVEFRKKKRIIFKENGKRIEKLASPYLVIRAGGADGELIEGSA